MSNEDLAEEILKKKMITEEQKQDLISMLNRRFPTLSKVFKERLAKELNN